MTPVAAVPPEDTEPSVATSIPSAAGRLRTSRFATLLVPRLPLLGVLVVITILASRLMTANTVFLDEATYLNAGHAIWHTWMHGGTHVRYPTYFSGAPVIYPVIASGVDAIGGLVAARVLSLVFVLVTICLLHATARRLFGARAAAWAVLAFGTLAATEFIAALATFDAMALMLMALSVWISIRCVESDRLIVRAGLLYLGAPILALANATKYATALYDPVVLAVVALAIAGRYGWRKAIGYAAMYTVVVAALLAGALAIGGHEYVTGVSSTTLNRPDGTATSHGVLHSAERWVGVLAALSGIAVVVAAFGTWRRRVWNVATVSSLALMAVLSVAVVLAPLEQARILTSISLQKHVAFGAWFAAIAAGTLLAGLSGPRIRAWWRWTPALAAMVALGLVGHQQAESLYRGWTNTTSLTASLRPLVNATDRPVLMDDSDEIEYYLGSEADPGRWKKPYNLKYTVPGTDQVLFGAAAVTSAIAHDYFGLVAIDVYSPLSIDQVVRRAIATNHHYRPVGKVALQDNFGTQRVVLWVDQHPEAGQ